MKVVKCDCESSCDSWMIDFDSEEEPTREQLMQMAASESMYEALKDAQIVIQMFVSKAGIAPDKIMINVQDQDGTSLGILNVQRVLDFTESAIRRADGKLQ